MSHRGPTFGYGYIYNYPLTPWSLRVCPESDQIPKVKLQGCTKTMAPPLKPTGEKVQGCQFVPQKTGSETIRRRWYLQISNYWFSGFAFDSGWAKNLQPWKTTNRLQLGFARFGPSASILGSWAQPRDQTGWMQNWVGDGSGMYSTSTG